MIKGVIFDLDNCLCAANEAGEALYRPAFDAIRKANHGIVSDETLAKAFSDTWRKPLDVVAREHGFSQEMLEAGRKAFATIRVDKLLHGYADIAILPVLPVKRFLVTTGFFCLQQSKIDALRFKELFYAIHIDAVDNPDRVGKEQIFASIMRTHEYQPKDLLVVGDDPHSEIECGNRLGIPTVQILRPGVTRGDNATYHVHSFVELKALVVG